MTLSPSLHAYAAELDALTRAKDAKRGIRIYKGELRAARYFMNRVHKARALDRRKSIDVYQKGDPMYGVSEFDCVHCYLREDTEGGHWVYMEKWETVPENIEELP